MLSFEEYAALKIREKAKWLVGMVQGTMALEGQGLPKDVLDEWIEDAMKELPHNQEFMDGLKEWYEDLKKQDDERKLNPREEIIVDHLTLSNNQKKAILNYVLVSGEGLFEDCEELWEGMTQDEVDRWLHVYEVAVEKYINEIKARLLSELT